MRTGKWCTPGSPSSRKPGQSMPVMLAGSMSAPRAIQDRCCVLLYPLLAHVIDMLLFSVAFFTLFQIQICTTCVCLVRNLGKDAATFTLWYCCAGCALVLHRQLPGICQCAAQAIPELRGAGLERLANGDLDAQLKQDLFHLLDRILRKLTTPAGVLRDEGSKWHC